MLGNRSLSQGVLSAGPMDDISQHKIQYRLGGKFPEGDNLADLYDQTGSIRVARTLAAYQKKRGQQGMILDESGRVYKDIADQALQGKMENKDTPFQVELRKQEAAAASDPSITQFMWEGKPIAIGQGAGGGGEVQAGGGATTVGGGSSLAERKRQFEMIQENDAYLDGQNDPMTYPDHGPGWDTNPQFQDPNQAGDDGGMNWWEENRGQVGNAVGDLTEGVMNVLPHMGNIRDYKQLPGITAPMLQRGPPLERPNLDSYKQAIIAQGRNMQNMAAYDSSQTGSQVGQRAQALAKTQSELSRLAGYEGNLRADIANKERMANAQVDQSNLRSINQYYDDVTERSLYQTQGIASERSKIASNILGFVGGQRQRKLDRQNMSLMEGRYAHEGFMNRAIEAAVKEEDWEKVDALTSGRTLNG